MNLHAGTYFGVPLYFNFSWFIFMGFLGIFFDEINFLIILATFLFAILHEYGHCLMAQYFGLHVEDITMYPIGGAARMDVPRGKAKEEFWITLAGPIVNFLIGFGCLMVICC